MDLRELINHPEQMDKETLYDLRSLLALYPYFQTARILMLQNLFILHDPSFNEELKKAAIYISDRKVLFNMIEATHYQLKKRRDEKEKLSTVSDANRTISLIDSFLESIPKDNEEETPRRKPTPADAAIDYVAYLVNCEEEKEDEETKVPQLKGQNLIDEFIKKDQGKIQLKDELEYTPDIQNTEHNEENSEEGFFTETLAKIYIKQGRYSKALEIIKRLNLNYPKKNAYFADQIRFLEKLILNNKNKK